MRDEELERLLGMGTNDRHFAAAELNRRRIAAASTPHWTLTPGFLVAVLAMIFAAIAAWPVVRDWIGLH